MHKIQLKKGLGQISHLLISMAILLIILTNCKDGVDKGYLPSPEWALVFKNSENGEELYGCKKNLIYALRSGSPLRIGFGGRDCNDTLKTIEHIADAQFVNIANGKEVFAQIETINRQRLDLNEEPLSMQFRKDKKLSMIVGTNGKLSTLLIDLNADTVRRTKTSTRGFSWFVFRSTVDSTSNFSRDFPPVEPLWYNTENRRK